MTVAGRGVRHSFGTRHFLHLACHLWRQNATCQSLTRLACYAGAKHDIDEQAKEAAARACRTAVWALLTVTVMSRQADSWGALGVVNDAAAATQQNSGEQRWK